MLSTDALKRRGRWPVDPGAPMPDPIGDDRLAKMYAEDEAASVQDAKDLELARLGNRKIMRTELSKQKRVAADEARENEFKMIQSPFGDMTDTNWATFYGNNETARLAQGLSNGGVPTPQGPHLMGSGDAIGSAGDAERANDARQAAALLALQKQSSAGGGGGGSSRPMEGGEVTFSPGGNYSRGPAMGEMDVEALKQARAKTTAMEQGVPSVAAERERNNALFGLGTGTDALLAQHSGNIAGTKAGTQKATEAKIGAQTMMDPDVWRAEEYKRKWALEAQQPKVDIAQGKNDADIRKAQLAAWAKTQAETIKGDSMQKIAMARLIEESLADAGNSFSAPDQEALRALAAELKGQSSLLSPAAAALIRGPQ